MEKIEFETVLVQSAKLPMVKIDREIFLRKELKYRYSKEVVAKAIDYNPAYAGIPVEEINKIAKSCIKAETIRVTALSAAAGIPGGFALVGTIPADVAQYFGHVLRILQELIYLYGWQDLELNEKEVPEEAKNLLTLFTGIMFGVVGATVAVNKLAEQVAKQIAKKLPQKALMKTFYYPIVKKIAGLLGIRMTRDIFAKGVAKAVPVLGAATSGGLTLGTFYPMAEKLRKYLASCEVADIEKYKQLEEGIVEEEKDNDT